MTPAPKTPPAHFEYCAICRGYQHPNWHDPVWRQARYAAGDLASLRTYRRDHSGAYVEQRAAAV
jgi:hypothetical protein